MKLAAKQLAMLAAMLVSTFALAAEFPSAPPNLKEVEAQGLPRLSAEELKALFPAVIDSKGPTGRHLITHNADGSCLRQAAKRAVGGDASGTWRIVEKDNTYCRSLPRMGKGVMAKGGYQENCFAVFRAKDGVHYFDYDVDDGFFAHVWRKAEGQ